MDGNKSLKGINNLTENYKKSLRRTIFESLRIRRQICSKQFIKLLIRIAQSYG